TALGALFAILLSSTAYAGHAYAQPKQLDTAAGQHATSPWDREVNGAAAQADVWFDNYKFRDGQTLERLRIHYATLGTPHRNANGDLDNAVLILHWTGADSQAL